ncbi:MAG: sn-glycerol-1-phosphate dehydrogenase [Anaerostipes sp.]|nr:sn-glycerol-1-phosphate dehydrogenase [Anaerostipes sp.]MDD3746026.1 sn-glycerol-1-phosphate dehydrogenase [Anaerostipes sp.]
MNEILKLSINEMANASFDCSCGRHHTFGVDDLIMGKGVLPQITEILKDYKNKKIYMISDNNTFKAAGKDTLKILTDAGFQVKSNVIDSGDDILIPDEKAVGNMFMELEKDTEVIVSVGSGTLNDMAKFMSQRTRIPYVIVCTAPSMDGYASEGAPLIYKGRKISYDAWLPMAILGDTNIMKDAPMHMLRAGYGDVIGKLTALADWRLSQEQTGEYFCETITELVQKAIKKVVDSTDALAKREEDAVLYLIEALTLTGVAMGLIGVSRPASGAEHMLSHYWEMAFIEHGKYPELHGIKVGIATPIIAQIFEEMRDELPESVIQMMPSRDYVEDLLKRVGAPVYPTDVKIDKELFYRSIIEGNTVRERYSILDLAVKKGKIEEIAQKLTDRFYN